jgi:hypothetical protein
MINGHYMHHFLPRKKFIYDHIRELLHFYLPEVSMIAACFVSSQV